MASRRFKDTNSVVGWTASQAQLFLVTLARDFTFASLGFHICKMAVRIATPRSHGTSGLSVSMTCGPCAGGDGVSSRAESCKPHLVAGTGFQTSFPLQTVMPEAWE